MERMGGYGFQAFVALLRVNGSTQSNRVCGQNVLTSAVALGLVHCDAISRIGATAASVKKWSGGELQQAFR